MADEEKKNEEEEVEEENEEGTEDEDGEEGDGEEDGDGKKKKKKKKGGKKKKIIIIAIALLVVVAIAVPAALYLTGKIGGKSAAGEDEHVESSGGEGGEFQSVFYDMEEFVVNLNVGSKRPSFLKMTVSLEVANELQIPTIERGMPRVRDSFQVYLRELRQEDLNGSAGLYRLREELLLRVNKIVYPAKINDILFKEILVQ